MQSSKLMIQQISVFSAKTTKCARVSKHFLLSSVKGRKGEGSQLRPAYENLLFINMVIYHFIDYFHLANSDYIAFAHVK